MFTVKNRFIAIISIIFRLYTMGTDDTKGPCLLCRMLNQPVIQRQSYEDIASWYLDVCEERGSFPWSREKAQGYGCQKKDMLNFKDMGISL